MLKLKRSCHVQGKIPDASMADIAFLLIIFFMVTKSAYNFDKLPVSLPATHDATRVDLPTRGALNITVAANGETRIENLIVSMLDIQNIAEGAAARDANRVFIIRADRHVAFRVVDGIIERLRRAHVKNIALETRSAGGGFIR